MHSAAEWNWMCTSGHHQMPANFNSILPPSYGQRSYLFCCWRKSVEKSAQWCHICLVAAMSSRTDRKLLCYDILWHFPNLTTSFSAFMLLVGWHEGHSACKNGGVLAWLSVWGKLQICIWPNWCHCHWLSLAPINPNWFYLSGTCTSSPG